MAIICGKHRHDTVAQVRACQLSGTSTATAVKEEVERIRPISPAGRSLARGAGIPLAEIEASRAHWAEPAQTEYVGGTVVWDKEETTEPQIEEVWPWAGPAELGGTREGMRERQERRKQDTTQWTTTGAPGPTDAQSSYLSSLLRERDLSTCLAWAKSVEEAAEGNRLTKTAASRAIARLKLLPRKDNPTPAPATVAPNQDPFPDVPAGRYALRSPISGIVKFYVLDRPTQGRWAGAFFLNAQASSEKFPIKNPVTKREILTAIAKDPQAAQALYGQELGRCYACGRVLTDETSRALGIGPDCRSK